MSVFNYNAETCFEEIERLTDIAAQKRVMIRIMNTEDSRELIIYPTEKRTEERTETHTCDLVSRRAAIDELNVSAELLKRVLDDADVVGAERAKYEWGLGLIESSISDIKDLPSAQPEIIRCKDCKHRPYLSGKYDCNSCCGLEIIFPDYRCPCRCDDEYYNYIPGDNWFCGNAERIEEVEG